MTLLSARLSPFGGSLALEMNEFAVCQVFSNMRG